MRYPLLWCLLLISPRAENYVRIESPADGRNYTVDLDSTAVQRALRPVTEAALAGKLQAERVITLFTVQNLADMVTARAGAGVR